MFWGNVAKNQKVKTFSNYGKEYEVELKLKLKHPNAFNHAGSKWRHILHITKGGNGGEFGDRIPIIAVHQDNFIIGTIHKPRGQKLT